MVDLNTKKIIFESGLIKQYQKYLKALYFYNKYITTGEVPNYDYEEDLKIDSYQKEVNPDLWDCTRRVYNARKRKIIRLKKKIAKLLSMGECLFCTFTFSEDSLNNLSQLTRRRYVTEFARSQSNLFVGNIDFGDTTEREHYHFIILKDFIKNGSFPYGFDYYEKIRVDSSDVKLSKYLNKLVNHSVKISTGCNNIIYSSKLEELSKYPENVVVSYTMDGWKVIDYVNLEELSEEDSNFIDNIF